MGGGKSDREPQSGAAEALGLPAELVKQLADYKSAVAEVENEGEDYDGAWPENVRAISIFAYMRGQWRMGFNGPVALDLSALEACSRAAGCGKMGGVRELDKLQIMEAEALKCLAKSK